MPRRNRLLAALAIALWTLFVVALVQGLPPVDNDEVDAADHAVGVALAMGLWFVGILVGFVAIAWLRRAPGPLHFGSIGWFGWHLVLDVIAWVATIFGVNLIWALATEIPDGYLGLSLLTVLVWLPFGLLAAVLSLVSLLAALPQVPARRRRATALIRFWLFHAPLFAVRGVAWWGGIDPRAEGLIAELAYVSLPATTVGLLVQLPTDSPRPIAAGA